MSNLPSVRGLARIPQSSLFSSVRRGNRQGNGAVVLLLLAAIICVAFYSVGISDHVHGWHHSLEQHDLREHAPSTARSQAVTQSIRGAGSLSANLKAATTSSVATAAASTKAIGPSSAANTQVGTTKLTATDSKATANVDSSASQKFQAGSASSSAVQQQEQQQQQHGQTAPPPSPSRPPRPPMTPERFAWLHSRPALATHNLSAGPYPHIKWPRYTERELPAPSKEQLDPNASNPYVVLQYRGTFWSTSFATKALPCSVPCMITSDPSYDTRTDVMVFHGPHANPSSLPNPKRPGMLFAIHSMESEGYYPEQKAGSATMKLMDIQMTTKMHPLREDIIHVPCPYANNHEYGNYTRIWPDGRNKSGVAIWMHNNCHAVSQRQEVVRRLMQAGLPVHAPGGCMHNFNPPQGAQRTGPVGLVSKYKFYLSMENVFDDPDWVSSTFFRNLDAGTVPVYLGAPNILKYAPGERSIIRACDFDSPDDLVDYLLALNSNQTAYDEYLKWKYVDGPSPEFKSMVSMHDTSVWCSMCIHTAAKKGFQYDADTEAKIKAHVERKKQWDVLNARLDRERSIPCRGKTRWWDMNVQRSPAPSPSPSPSPSPTAATVA